ncbi:MAG TPA: phosphatidate cytidylyltransferase [Candidatus Binatia bacterium]
METNLKRRLLTALIAISLVIVIVGWARPWIFTVFILSMTALALYEYFAMALPGYPGEQVLGVLFGVTVSFLLVIPDLGDRELWLSLLLVLSFTGYLFARGKLHEKLTRLAWTVLGGFYIGLLMPNWIFLFRVPDGRSWVFFVLGVIVAGDTVAYFAGKRFGVKRLAPEISPAKTVAGAWGYLLGSVVAGAFAALLLLVEYPFLEITLLALILAALGQLGDLFESLLKRVFAVKDSGSLLPGHGGILDRLDSLIFPAVFANAYLRVFH